MSRFQLSVLFILLDMEKFAVGGSTPGVSTTRARPHMTMSLALRL